MKKKGKSSPFLIIGVVVCSLCFAVFALLLYVFMTGGVSFSGADTADAALSGLPPAPAPAPVSPPPPTPENPQSGEMPASSPAPAPTVAPMSGPPPSPPDISLYRAHLTGSDYVTVRMDESEIHKGYLLLVNNDYRYDIPDDLDLVAITGARNSSYRVYSQYSRLRSPVMGPLNDMMQDFADGTENTIFRQQNAYMYIISAFRNYSDQRRELNDQIYLHGQAAAAARTKEPGHSEHHTGLAFDLATVIDGVQHPFDYFDLTRWFSRNSYKYGFILRYPSNKTAITKTIYEPWHYRYVGLPHSYIMRDNGWALEEYIDKIRGYTMEKPLRADYAGASYEVYFTDSSDITVPVHASYDISGNNVDGYIVTISARYDRLTNVSGE